MIGLMSFRINGGAMTPPELNRQRALAVLSRIEEILAWEKSGASTQRDERYH